MLAEAETEGVPVRRAPQPTALVQTPVTGVGLELAPVAIEDLLNRPQWPLDREGMARLVRGRRVLVTGAGGTIGSELARQVAGLAPSSLVLWWTTANTRCGRSTWSWRSRTRTGAPAGAHRRRAGRGAHPGVDGRSAAGTGVPRRGAEARADRGGEPWRGLADQRVRHAARGGCGTGGRRCSDGVHLVR